MVYELKLTIHVIGFGNIFIFRMDMVFSCVCNVRKNRINFYRSLFLVCDQDNGLAKGTGLLHYLFQGQVK
ncbi:MAG: hypothetical protein Ta2E_12740 [Mycoplasmoidaceae bacterium]|nr:MAG: hypothetical protein Ta2E_12740 [Mycoplasmoidaceae bacterium]